MDQSCSSAPPGNHKSDITVWTKVLLPHLLSLYSWYYYSVDQSYTISYHLVMIIFFISLVLIKAVLWFIHHLQCGPKLFYRTWTTLWSIYHVVVIFLQPYFQWHDGKLPSALWVIYLTNWGYTILVVFSVWDCIVTHYVQHKRTDITGGEAIFHCFIYQRRKWYKIFKIKHQALLVMSNINICIFLYFSQL